MVVLGGLGSIPGTVIGAAVLTAAPEFLRFMADYRMLVYGVHESVPERPRWTKEPCVDLFTTMWFTRWGRAVPKFVLNPPSARHRSGLRASFV